jgi:hypothetical protein
MSDGFAGDPFHEGGSQPLASLKGGMSEVNTQAPMAGTNDENSNQNPGPFAGWNTTSLGSAPSGTGSNDKNIPH